MTKGFNISFLLTLSVVLLPARPTDNFGVSHYTRLDVGPRGVRATYILDLAEVPTFTLLKSWNLTAASPQAALDAKAAEQAREWAKGLEFRSADRTLDPEFLNASVQVRTGADGQATARIATTWDLPGVKSPLHFEDHNYPDRAGWKEIVIRGVEGVRLVTASQDGVDRSQALTDYPPGAAPQDLRASVEWSTAAGAVHTRIVPIAQPAAVAAVTAVAATPAQPPRNPGFLERLLQMQHIPLSWMLVGLLAAMGLGGAHALTPGHGKTIVAAYLVGSRGTFKHAALLGGLVTFTHTISVFALGLGTLFLAAYVNQYKVTKALEAISGVGIVAIGASMFYKRLTQWRHARQHRLGQEHDHHHHRHDHGPGGHTHTIEGEVTMNSLVTLGVSGGLVPCPDALILLLFSISVGHVGAGLILLLGFSAGLAVVLIGIGMLVLYAKQWLPQSSGASEHPLFLLIPALSALVVVCLGLLMTGVSLGLVRPGLFG